MHGFASCISSSQHERFVMKNEADSSHTGLSPPVGIRGVRAGAATLTRAFLSSEAGTALTAAPRCCRRPPSARQPLPRRSRSFTAPLMFQVRLDGWWLVGPPPATAKLQLSADVFKK